LRRIQVENRIPHTGRAGFLSRSNTKTQGRSTFGLPETTDSRPIPYVDPAEKTSEEITKLIQRLFISTGTAVPQVVVVSGVEQGSGCSWVCARIAECLTSHLDRSVCLVDANPHSASPVGQAHSEDGGTVVDPEWLLSPFRHTAQPLSEANLWLLSYRPIGEGWQRPESLARFESRLSEMRKDFSYILVDAPPINAYGDASLFGRMADGVVMVLEANRTRRESAQKAKRILDRAGVTVLGAVLNKRTFPIPEFLYRRL